MKKIIFLAVMFLLSGISKGQVKPETDFNINKFLQRNIRMTSVMKENDFVPATFVKVYINKKAGVDSIAFLAGTLSDVKSEVTRVIDLMRGKPYFQAFKRKIVVIPLIYTVKVTKGKSDINYAKLIDEQTDVMLKNQLTDYKMYTYIAPVIIKVYTEIRPSTIVY